MDSMCVRLTPDLAVEEEHVSLRNPWSQEMSLRMPLSTRSICTILAVLAMCFSMGPSGLLAQVAANQKMSDDDATGAKGRTGSNSDPSASSSKLNAEILKELERMRLRIQELEAQLRGQQGPSDSA